MTAARRPDRPARSLGRRDWKSHPQGVYRPYRSTPSRTPGKPLVPLPAALSERAGPVYGHDSLAAHDNDLTLNARVNGQPLGERIIVAGAVRDEKGRPMPGVLVEIWQANAAGRYIHRAEIHDAPLDPNFFGAGRTLTGKDGRYRFVTVRPGAYPWGNHFNAWRPAHIHFSVLGPSFAQRLVTQMFFPGDPLCGLDPIFNSVRDARARARMVAKFDINLTRPEWALGYEFDIVLRGERATPMEA